MAPHELLAQFIEQHFLPVTLSIVDSIFLGPPVQTRMVNAILASTAMKVFTSLVNKDRLLGAVGIMKITSNNRVATDFLPYTGSVFFALLILLREWKGRRDAQILAHGASSLTYSDPKYIIYAGANVTLSRNPLSISVLNRCMLSPNAAITVAAPLGDAAYDGMDRIRQLFFLGERTLNVALLAAVEGSERKAVLQEINDNMVEYQAARGYRIVVGAGQQGAGGGGGAGIVECFHCT